MKHLSGDNAQARIVGQRTAIRVTRRFSAPAQRVFNAWLEPEITRKWLFATALNPMTEVEIDARVGGTLRLAERRDGGIVEHRGEYVEILPPRRLVFNLVMADRPRVLTRVTVAITPMRTGCNLALSHEDVPLEHADRTEARWTGSLYGLGVTDSSTDPGRRLSTSGTVSGG
jgi:uncharacterized protein YndB with AHSA1/START domain